MDGQNQLLWRDFERDLKVAARSPRTIQSYEEAAQQLIDFHRGAFLEDLTKTEIQDYLLHVIDEHSPTTAGVRYRSLRRFYNWMVAEEVLEQSPMRRIIEPKADEDIPTDIPPLENVRALLATAEPKVKSKDTRRLFNDHRDAAIIRLFCEAGAPRISEMANMEVGRLDMGTDVVTFMGKGRKWRTIPFGNKTGKALTRYLRARARHPLATKRVAGEDVEEPRLWLGWRQLPIAPSGIYQMMKRRCDEAGIPRIHPHQLRHFATDRWYEEGGSQQDAMQLFGWSSPTMAHHYASKHAGKRAIQASRRTGIGDSL